MRIARSGLNFDTPARDRVKVEYDWDQRDENDKVLGNELNTKNESQK